MLEWLARFWKRKSEPEPPELAELKREYPTIHDAANAFIVNFGPAFTETPAGHIETDIAGAACIAGSCLLRSAGIDLSTLPAGSVLLSEPVNERLEILFQFAAVAAYQVQLPMESSAVDVPPEHQPLLDVVDLVRKLRTPFENACEKGKVKREFHPHVGVLTAMKLVKAGQQLQLLDPTIGRSLLAQYLVAGAKTVPGEDAPAR